MMSKKNDFGVLDDSSSEDEESVSATYEIPKAPIAIEDRAVTVEWLVNFADKFHLWGKKTWEVVEDVIKPKTEKRRCRFSDLTDAEFPECPIADHLGRVDTFLSHCWANEFGLLVAAAKHHACKGRRYWIDIFAVNQHHKAALAKVKLYQADTSGKALKRVDSVAEVGGGVVVANQPVGLGKDGTVVPQFEADLDELTSVIRAAKQGTTLVMCPRAAIKDKRRNPLKRVWCVEEMRETIEEHRPLVIKCGSVREVKTDPFLEPDKHSFNDEQTRELIKEYVDSVNVSEAEATVANDKKKIMKKLEKAGLDIVNESLKHALWVSFSARGLPAFEIGLQNGLQTHSQYSIHDENPEGWTALHVAAHAGLAETVEILLGAGAVVNCRTPKGRTPAFHAAWQWELDVLKVLQKHGADLNARDEYGVSVAARADMGGNSSRRFKTAEHMEKVQEWLKEHGAVIVKPRQIKVGKKRGARGGGARGGGARRGGARGGGARGGGARRGGARGGGARGGGARGGGARGGGARGGDVAGGGADTKAPAKQQGRR